MIAVSFAGKGPRLLRLVVLVALGGGCLVLSSCGGKTNPVRGKVTYKGEPCKGAFVVFHPVGGGASPRPNGTVEDDGTFLLTTDPKRPGDGAPPGEYIVAITWTTPPPSQPGKMLNMGSSETRENPPDRLNGKYRDEKVSKLRVTITPGKNELDPFDLK